MNVPQREPEASPADPTACPFCRATTIRSPGEKRDPQAYWRCEACGEMWNVARPQVAAKPYNYDSRWK